MTLHDGTSRAREKDQHETYREMVVIYKAKRRTLRRRMVQVSFLDWRYGPRCITQILGTGSMIIPMTRLDNASPTKHPHDLTNSGGMSPTCAYSSLSVYTTKALHDWRWLLWVILG